MDWGKYLHRFGYIASYICCVITATVCVITATNCVITATNCVITATVCVITATVCVILCIVNYLKAFKTSIKNNVEAKNGWNMPA